MYIYIYSSSSCNSRCTQSGIPAPTAGTPSTHTTRTVSPCFFGTCLHVYVCVYVCVRGCVYVFVCVCLCMFQENIDTRLSGSYGGGNTYHSHGFLYLFWSVLTRIRTCSHFFVCFCVLEDRGAR